MSIISNLFKAVFGGAPKVSGASVSSTQANQKSAAAARASLYGTEGGVIGDELETDQVQRRQTLFGN